jgi:hypothetical protein
LPGGESAQKIRDLGTQIPAFLRLHISRDNKMDDLLQTIPHGRWAVQQVWIQIATEVQTVRRWKFGTAVEIRGQVVLVRGENDFHRLRPWGATTAVSRTSLIIDMSGFDSVLCDLTGNRNKRAVDVRLIYCIIAQLLEPFTNDRGFRLLSARNKLSRKSLRAIDSYYATSIAGVGSDKRNQALKCRSFTAIVVHLNHK